MAATAEETQMAIEALLSLGTDLPVPNTDLDENATLVPLAPQHIALQSSTTGTSVKKEDKGTSSKATQPDAKKKKNICYSRIQTKAEICQHKSKVSL